jgi:hypothetical protein
MNNRDTTTNIPFRNFGCAYNAVISSRVLAHENTFIFRINTENKFNYSQNIKIRPEISVTRENQSVEIKIKIDLRKRNDDLEQNDYSNVETPQEMVEKYKLHNDICAMVKPCW